jgi:hypothetical protein
MKNIEVQMLIYTLTKKIIEVQGNMLNPFGTILSYKMVMWWFDGQDIGVEPRRPWDSIPFTNIYYVEYVYLYIYLVHVCCIIFRWVMDR